jgi:hypothetical protein
MRHEIRIHTSFLRIRERMSQQCMKPTNAGRGSLSTYCIEYAALLMSYKKINESLDSVVQYIYCEHG